MLDVYWLEQSEADVPVRNDWLSDAEIAHLNALRVPKRHADWRLGRWTAKCALASYLRIALDPHVLSAMEISPAESGAPRVLRGDEWLPIVISISHSHGASACAVAEAGAALGCDLEWIEPRSDPFIADYFAPEEQALLARIPPPGRDHVANLLWSAKESALKALQAGLRLDTRSLHVRVADLLLPASAGWHPLEVRLADGPVFHGWWQESGEFVRTLVASPAPAVPTALAKAQFVVS